ncbi:helix-turn-helix transcriptional regulator [Prauserella marina]|nr:LuxR C-terminal-related transcriptional regulator [Prauserella marina]ASR39790.1 helix-turn-helix transcriptional regulator [Prauserella marina]
MLTSRPELVFDEPTRQLCAAVGGGTLSPAKLAVVAPGGYGKTAVLDHIGECCAREGLPAARYGEHDGDTRLVLLDDAHLLDEPGLAEVADLAADDKLGLIVAARPWPRSAELNAVLALLRGQVVLRPLDRARTARILGAGKENLADFVLRETGGVPGWVSRLAGAIGTKAEIPHAALMSFASHLDRLSPDTLSYLLAAQYGVHQDPQLVAGLLGGDGATTRVSCIVEEASAAGLLGSDGNPPPLVHKALNGLIPFERHTWVRQRLLRLQLDRGGPVLPLVRPLLHGQREGAAPPEAFEAAAREAAPTEPQLAAGLFAAAVAAGVPMRTVAASWAEAAARAGDGDTALRIADQAVADPAAIERADAARIAGTVLTQRGQLARGTELFRWSATGLSKVYAAIGLLGSGAVEPARLLLAEPSGGEPPTLIAGAMSATAQAIVDSVSRSATSVLTTLVSAAETMEPVGRQLLLPDTPAALGALAGMHCGELGVAEALLERAKVAEAGGPTMKARHSLLHAWTAMVRGETEVAAERLAGAGEQKAGRDWLFAVALRAGLARRAGDLAALRAVWGEVCDAVIRQPVDLFTLLPFGELAIAAARLGERDRLAHHLDLARGLLRSLSDPPLWTAPFHWSGLHAAIMVEHEREAHEHAEALAASSGHSGFHAVVADAAGCWLRVLGGDVDPDRIERAARDLHAAGLCWDGARLAGQAAIRTTDRSAMVRLLDCARVLRGDPGNGAIAEPDGSPKLSERELQVAELVVSGMTYRQVGDQLFISAKTVEHHVARMRQRLGATSRGDLLAQLRVLVADRAT